VEEGPSEPACKKKKMLSHARGRLLIRKEKNQDEKSLKCMIASCAQSSGSDRNQPIWPEGRERTR